MKYAALIVALAIPSYSSAQYVPVIQLRIESTAVESGSMGTTESLPGIGLSVGADESGGSWRISLSHAPEGDIRPGSQAAIVELGPQFTLVSSLNVAARAFIGGHRMNVENRHAALAGCRPEDGCMFEARAFEQGWATIGGGVIEAALTVAGSGGLTASARAGRLLKGANAPVWLPTWSVGFFYRFR